MQRKNVGQVKPDVNKELSYRKAAPLYSVQKHYGMTNGADGFTLIELLVVVLIIGILAAVAVPQYTLAVNKSRFANYRTLAENITKAAQAYRLANGSWPSDFDELAIDLPSGFTTTTSESNYSVCGNTNDMYCCLFQGQDGYWAASVSCGKNDYSFVFHTTFNNLDSYCVAKTANSNALKLCKSFQGTKGQWVSLRTPEGFKSGYEFYKLN